MNGIKMSDCKFYVNEAERTVVCVIPRTKHLLREFIEDNFNFRDICIPRAIFTYWDEDDVNFYMLNMPHSFTGKAVCAPEDEWNEDTGRLIAFSRAKDKCYKSFFKRANHLVQAIDRRLGDMIESFNNFGMKLEGKRIELQHKIDESMGLNIEE